jgi:PAS domain S-box-containing protein
MDIPTEPIGSIPRPIELVDALARTDGDDPALDDLYDAALRDTIARFDATGSPVITDGEQRKYHNFWTYCVHGLPNVGPGGFQIPFAAGHTRRMPRLLSGPFRYRHRADSYLDEALKHTRRAVKQAVISPSALSLLYPAEEIPGYPREQFIDDLLNEHVDEVRACLEKGAHKVQIDFTEGRLAMKVDPSGDLLHRFIELNNLALSRFSAEEQQRIGVHTCPGGDRDSTHSADVGLCRASAESFRTPGRQLLRRPGRRTRPAAGPRDDPAKPEAGAARLCRRDRAHRPDGRDRRGRARPGSGSSAVHPAGPAGNHRRLRLRAFLRRHLHEPRCRLREDPGEGGGYRRGGAAGPGQLMHAEADAGDDAELTQLQTVALRNGHTILQARNRAEEDLRNAKAAFEQRTVELDQSLTLMQATLDSTADGILVTDSAGRVIAFNNRFLRIWGLSAEQVRSAAHADLSKQVERLFPDSEHSKARLEQIYADQQEEVSDVLSLTDGRTFERVSRMLDRSGLSAGRVWSYRDVTARHQAEDALRDQARMLDLLNQTGSALSATLDLNVLLQRVTDAATALSGASSALSSTTRLTSRANPSLSTP